MSSVNLFEIENARNFSIQDLVDTFVDTPSYWKLFSRKNHIVLGSRGSGKTSLAKMLSHNHLCKFKHDRAQDIIQSKQFIGIFIPMSAEWLGGVNNIKNAPEQSQRLFISKLNIKSCKALIDTIKSCLNYYSVDTLSRISSEIEIVEKLRDYWFPLQSDITNIKEVEDYLNKIDFEKQIVNIKQRITGELNSHNIGIEFDVDLFAPLKNGIDVLTTCIGLEDASWLICLDEAEILTTDQQQLINSYLRSCAGNMFFKIITMPYAHTTRLTTLGANLNLGDDFEYLYIDNESTFFYSEYATTTPDAIKKLFDKRVRGSSLPQDITIENLLGGSLLLDKKAFDATPGSKDMELFYKYADDKTINRAESLLSRQEYKAFNNQIGRKMRGLLYLRDNIANAQGRTKVDVYSGARMVVQCSDGNPRKLIRLFKLLLEANEDKNISKSSLMLPMRKQSDILIGFSTSTLLRIQSEEKIGPSLYALLLKVGGIMHDKIHKAKLSTEQTYSIRIENDIDDETWLMIQKAVDNGLLYPKASSDIFLYKQGTFRLAYVLCPFFKLLPRKGRSINLNAILDSENKVKKEALSHKQQLELF